MIGCFDFYAGVIGCFDFHAGGLGLIYGSTASAVSIAVSITDVYTRVYQSIPDHATYSIKTINNQCLPCEMVGSAYSFQHFP